MSSHHRHLDTDQLLTPTGADRELARTKREICTYLENTVASAGADGVVIAMSGGLDSTLTTVLATEALGPDRVIGLGLPVSKTDGISVSEARTIADGLGIEFEEIQLRPLLEVFDDLVATPLGIEDDPRARGNAVSRVRMCCAYLVANAQNRLVCGTANRSELLLGYFTKYGDGGADFHPLGDLYKTEVRELAKHVGVPRRIIEKQPTAGLEAGQTDADDLGAGYADIDPLLERVVEGGEPVERVLPDLDIDGATAADILVQSVETSHKRRMPSTPETAAVRTALEETLCGDDVVQ